MLSVFLINFFCPRFTRPLAQVVTAAVISLLLNIVDLVIHVEWSEHESRRQVYYPSVVALTVSVLTLSSVTIDATRQRRKIKSNQGTMPCSHVRMLGKQLLWLLNLGCVIVSIAALTIGAIKDQNTNQPVMIVLSSLATVAEGLLCYFLLRLHWWPLHLVSRTALTVSSLLQFVIGTLLIIANLLPFADPSAGDGPLPVSRFAFFQQVGAFITANAVLGLAVSSVIRESNRISDPFARFILLFMTIAGLLIVFCVVIIAVSIRILVRTDLTLDAEQATLVSDIVLGGLSIILSIVSIFAGRRLQARPPSHLAVQTLDLAALTPEQRTAFSKRITEHGRHHPGAPSGAAAMSLMLAYCESHLPSMSCVVLRVYRPDTARQKVRTDNASYETIRAWKNLDEEKMVFGDTITRTSTSSAATLVDSPPKLSKNKLKRLARKQAAKGGNGTLTPEILAQLEDGRSSNEKKSQMEFEAMLKSTEALVLLTRVENYDLTAQLRGRFARVLQYLLPSDSSKNPFHVRVGLLSFHWPFRQSTFYCLPTSRPVARSAAVLRAIAEWNKALPPTERSSFLLDPTYQNDISEKAIRPSGWQSTPLPASNVIDLRPYKNKTLSEYLQAIHYRNQSKAFFQAGGTVIETSDFKWSECQIATDLWNNIAEKRAGGGNTSTMASPQADFLSQLGDKKYNDGFRSLLFLKVDGRTVASCVLFRLGDTITSDLQGLDYEQGRPLKAYFVMMQEVISIALKEGRSFVDFGPTTSKPKHDVGCESVPIIGGIHSGSAFLSFCIKFAASQVSI